MNDHSGDQEYGEPEFYTEDEGEDGLDDVDVDVVDGHVTSTGQYTVSYNEIHPPESIAGKAQGFH